MLVVGAVDFAKERQFVQRKVEEEEDGVVDEDAGRELQANCRLVRGRGGKARWVWSGGDGVKLWSVGARKLPRMETVVGA